MSLDLRPALLRGRVWASPAAYRVFDDFGWVYVQRLAKRLIYFVVAIVCLIVGAITLPTPLPLGAIFLAVGVALLVSTSKTARIWLQKFRAAFPRIDGGLRSIQGYLPKPLRRALRMSAPRRPQ